MTRFRFAAVLMIVVVVVSLSGCFFLPFPPMAGPENDRPVVDGPEGWTELPHCSGGPNDDWVWVDGFPSTAFDSAGIAPECGDTWIEQDGDSFLGIVNHRLTLGDLDEFGAALESAGYEKLVDDFDPSVERDYSGARDYYLDGVYEGGFTRLAVEIYANPADDTFTAYFDYLSPLTRELD